MQSPLLPWEVIERVIGHSGDDVETLHNFSLTCRDLRPRALCLLVADVYFMDRNQIFDFCDFLQANPHLKPLVCSIAVKPDDFSPFPLLSILPNLSKLKFYPIKYIAPINQKAITNVLNRSTVAYCKPLGTNIQALHLSELCFPTFLDFARLLLTFTNLKDLSCISVVFKMEANQAHLGVIKQRMSGRLHLSTLEIDFLNKSGAEESKSSVATVLLDALVVQSTVETLTMRAVRNWRKNLHQHTWSQVRTLVLKLESPHFRVLDAIAALKDFPLSTLKDITVEWRCLLIQHIKSELLDNPSLGLELEQTLLRFPRPNVTILVDYVRLGRCLFWTQEIGKHYFPVLFQRGAFKVTLNHHGVIFRAGHDDSVRDLATSSDGKWVATGSEDSTIILWETTGGTVVHQWLAHSYKSVTCLAFSPDSQFLVSGGSDSNLQIWDIAQGSRGVTTLKGHTSLIISCAWSPHGEMIASGSEDGSVRIWDSCTFRELCVLQHPNGSSIEFVAFSPDGHWLVSGSNCSCNIRNISGMLHKSLQTKEEVDYSPAAASSPRSMHLLEARHDVVKVAELRAGDELAVRLALLEHTRGVAFSPDGTLFLTASHDRYRMVRLWNADTGAKKFTLEGYLKIVYCACFSPCGKYVASASKDGTVRLWRTKDGSCVATFSDRYPSNIGIPCVAFCPDGEILWSGDEGGTVVMRRMRDILPSNEQAS